MFCQYSPNRCEQITKRRQSRASAVWSQFSCVGGARRLCFWKKKVNYLTPNQNTLVRLSRGRVTETQTKRRSIHGGIRKVTRRNTDDRRKREEKNPRTQSNHILFTYESNGRATWRTYSAPLDGASGSRENGWLISSDVCCHSRLINIPKTASISLRRLFSSEHVNQRSFARTNSIHQMN